MTLGRLEKKPTEEADIAYYKQLLRRTPEKHALLDFLADALYRQAEYQEAIHCWKKLLRKMTISDPQRILMKIAQAYEAMGEIEHAYYYFGEAKNSAPDSLDAIGKFGQMAYILENYEDALESFDIITDKEPFNEIAWHNLALTYYNLGFHDEAMEALEVSASLDEDSADTWYVLATIYSENYRLDEALFALEKALTIDPTLRESAKSEQSFYSLLDLSLFKMLLFY
ncbi:MAG: tetratricopeptide repeat protein [Asgard group archaeon]|nr:tetratricopeptide repeat protein [Asgard group archaeon]